MPRNIIALFARPRKKTRGPPPTGEVVYAHTPNDSFRIKYRLYELEMLLPHAFIRAAKSAIVNGSKIYAIKQGVTGSTLVSFTATHKQVYASRRYATALKKHMHER